MCVLCGCVEDRKELELRGFVRVTCASGPPDIPALPSEPRSLTRGPPIIGFESSVCCVIYCYPTSYRGILLLGKINIGDTFISYGTQYFVRKHIYIYINLGI